jgi:hypothetical protein
MAMMAARDGERGSYPEIVDTLAKHGARGKTDVMHSAPCAMRGARAI